jgi:hypothetical protein
MVLICDHVPGEKPDGRRSALSMTIGEELDAFNTAGFQDPTVRLESNGMVLYRAYGKK